MLKYDILICIKKCNKFIKALLENNATLNELFVLIPKKRKLDKIKAPKIKASIEKLMSYEKLPLPASIEIETYNKCNGDCDFCPINKNLDTREHKLMDKDLFYSIVSQLKELDYRGQVNAFSNNEPLLDDRIFDFVKYLKQELPNATKNLFTNGLLLNLDKFLELVSNLDFLVIDHYYEGKLELRENIKKIAKYCLEHPELKSKVKIQTINKHALRNNRGGNSKNRKYTYKLKSCCVYPFSQLIIRPTGQISLCCNDAMGKYTLGDLSKEKLTELWYGEKYSQVRKLILESRQKIDLCKNCDNFGVEDPNDWLKGYSIGNNWEKIEKLI